MPVRSVAPAGLSDQEVHMASEKSTDKLVDLLVGYCRRNGVVAIMATSLGCLRRAAFRSVDELQNEYN